MKSMTMMPPMSRSRSWRTISSAASRLFLVTVSSRLPPGAGELAGVDVDDRHRLGAVDDQRAARGQPDLAVEALGDLLVHAVRREQVLCPPSAGLEALEPLPQVGGDVGDVAVDEVPGVVALDDQLGEVLGEQVADDLEGEVGLAVQQLRGLAGLDLLLDVGPPRREPLDVEGQLVLRGALGGGADDHARGVGDDLLEQRLEAVALGVGELARDAGGVALGHVDQEPARQADLPGQPGALVADRVLGDLHQDRLAGGQHRLDLARLPVLVADGRPVDLAGVEHRVAALADVDERRLHRGQHVLHAAEVDVADQRGLRLAGDVVLDEHLVLEHADLGQVVLLADDHDPVDGLAAGEELGLADDRGPAAAGLAALATTLLLGLEPGRPADAGDLVLGVALLARPGAGAAPGRPRTRRSRRRSDGADGGDGGPEPSRASPIAGVLGVVGRRRSPRRRRSSESSSPLPSEGLRRRRPPRRRRRRAPPSPVAVVTVVVVGASSVVRRRSCAVVARRPCPGRASLALALPLLPLPPLAASALAAAAAVLGLSGRSRRRRHQPRPCRPASAVAAPGCARPSCAARLPGRSSSRGLEEHQRERRAVLGRRGLGAGVAGRSPRPAASRRRGFCLARGLLGAGRSVGRASAAASLGRLGGGLLGGLLGGGLLGRRLGRLLGRAFFAGFFGRASVGRVGGVPPGRSPACGAMRRSASPVLVGWSRRCRALVSSSCTVAPAVTRATVLVAAYGAARIRCGVRQSLRSATTPSASSRRVDGPLDTNRGRRAASRQ